MYISFSFVGLKFLTVQIQFLENTKNPLNDSWILYNHVKGNYSNFLKYLLHPIGIISFNIQIKLLVFTFCNFSFLNISEHTQCEVICGVVSILKYYLFQSLQISDMPLITIPFLLSYPLMSDKSNACISAFIHQLINNVVFWRKTNFTEVLWIMESD